jgi:hypothetical protein
MSDEQTEQPEAVIDPVAQRESHEGFVARMEAALHELPNPAHFVDWLKQEFAKFRA